jgi:hypothetical protein
VTTWVETPEGGRSRGPRGIARAWAEVLTHPRRFFENGVAPGDQAPGLAFAVVVAVANVCGLLAVQPTTVLGSSVVPVLGGSTALTTVLLLLVTAVVVAPAGLHLTAAIQTVALMLTVDDRAGVSETVQVVGYATAPCALAWLPLPGVTVACCLYGAALLVVGLAVVHQTSLIRAIVAAALPATLMFGVGYRGLWAWGSLTAGVAG